MSEPTSEKLDTFAILDLFGHQQIAGRVADVLIAGASFVRVDVPATDSDGQYTRYYHPNAIYSIAPCTEEVARAKAARLQARPVQVYELPRLEAPKGRQASGWMSEDDVEREYAYGSDSDEGEEDGDDCPL